MARNMPDCDDDDFDEDFDDDLEPDASDLDDYPDDDDQVDEPTDRWPEEDRVPLTLLGEVEAELAEIRRQTRAKGQGRRAESEEQRA